MTACLSFHKHCALWHQNLDYIARLFVIFAYPFSPFLIILLQWLVLLPVGKIPRKYHCDGQFLPWSSFVWIILLWIFYTQISEHFVYISGSIEPITLIWVSLERSNLLPADVEYRWRQFWSKVMTSEVKQRTRLITASCSWHGSQWVN